MQLAEAQIEKQPYDGDCAFTSVINLCKLRGLPPPTYDTLATALSTLRSVSPKPRMPAAYGGAYEQYEEAPTPMEVFTLLGFVTNLICRFGIVPVSLWPRPQTLFTRYLEEGHSLLLFYSWRSPESGRVVSHVSVAESYDDDRGYIILDGQPLLDGVNPTVEIEPVMYTPEQIERMRPEYEATNHGSRMVLPFFPIALPPDEPLGLNMCYVMASPLGKL